MHVSGGGEGGWCSGVGLVVAVVGTAVVEGGAIIEVCMLVVERCVYTRWRLWYGGMVGVVGRWLWAGVRRDKSSSRNVVVEKGVYACVWWWGGWLLRWDGVVAVVGRWLWTDVCRGKSSIVEVCMFVVGKAVCAWVWWEGREQI